MSKYEDIIKACERNTIPDSEIDCSEIPPITDFSGFHFSNEKYFKPKREQVSIRFSKYLVDHFRGMGKGWQTKLNDFLMEAVARGEIQDKKMPW